MSGKRKLLPVTGPQQAVLDFITSFTAANGFPPVVQDVQNRFHWRSPAAARKHLEALKFKGCVTWQPGKARTLRVTQEDAK